MPGFTIEEYAELRPFLWHITHAENLPLIRGTRVLCPARLLAGQEPTPRRSALRSPTGAVLRDQRLLHAGSVELRGGWSFRDLLQDLSNRVFFWSGWFDRPVRSGRAAMSVYATDWVIRVPFREIGREYTPYFSSCNSGATRMQHGRRVPRGPDTFLPCHECSFAAVDVVEVTFLEPIRLPSSATTRSPSTHWVPLGASTCR